MNRTRTRLAAAAMAAGCALTGLVACTGSSSTSAGSAAAAASAGPGGDTAGGRPGGAGSGGAAAAAAPQAGSGRTSAVSAVDVAAAERSRILTASVEVAVPDVRSAVSAASSAATGVGGFVGSADVQAASATTGAVATLTLRTPPGGFDRILGVVSALGTVRSSTRTEQDVTANVADLASRLATDRASIARVRILFAHAKSVGEVIALESALTDRESSLESLQAQQRALAGQVQDATVSLTLDGPAPKHAVVHPKPTRAAGFGSGLHAGWHALSNGARGLTVVLGALLPFTPLIAVAGVLVWWRVRRARTRTHAGV